MVNANAMSRSFMLMFLCASQFTDFLCNIFQSPDGYTVATAAADETLRFWNIFGNPEETKSAPKRKLEPFFDLAQIR